jgi:hypothetical protein
MRGFWLFIYSSQNIAGCILALIGLLLFFIGLINSMWPLIVIGMYGIGYTGFPRNEEIHLSIKEGLTTNSLLRELDSLIDSVRDRLSEPVMFELTRLQVTMKELLVTSRSTSNSSYDLHAAKGVITDYLPDLLEGYLKLPSAYARLHHLKDGRTPREVLLGQLETINEQMERTLELTLEGEADQLLVHERFINSKFAIHEEWV